MRNEEFETFLKNHAPLESRRLLLDGSQVGLWRVIAFVARGGCGEVYRVRNDSNGLVAVLKILAKDDEGLRHRFDLETDVLRRMAADGGAGAECFPRLIEHGEYADARRPYVIIEALNGFVLPKEDESVAKFLSLMCRAVSALHRNGYLHRDLKPDNIMCRADGNPVIIDFGLSTRIENLSPLAKDRTSFVNGQVVGVGTIGSSAPEQANGEASVRSDVYALGALISDCFGGNPPEEWRPIVQQATNPKPEFRYATPDDLADAIWRRKGAVKIQCANCHQLIDRFTSFCPYCGQITRPNAQKRYRGKWISCDKCGAEFGLKELEKSSGKCPHCHVLLPVSKYCFHIPEKRYLILYSVAPWWIKGLFVLCCALAVHQTVEAVMTAFPGGSQFNLGSVNYACASIFGQLLGVLIPAALVETIWRIIRARTYKDERLAYRIAKRSGADMSAVKPHGYKLSISAILLFVVIVGGAGISSFTNQLSDRDFMSAHREQDEQFLGVYAQERQRLWAAWKGIDLADFLANPADYLVATGSVVKTQKELKRASRIAADIVSNSDMVLKSGLYSIPSAQRESMIHKIMFEKDDFWLWFQLLEHSQKTIDHFKEWNGGDANGVLKREFASDDMDAIAQKLDEELVQYDEIMAKIQKLEGGIQSQTNDFP